MSAIRENDREKDATVTTRRATSDDGISSQRSREELATSRLEHL
jgi:hypothetical protein